MHFEWASAVPLRAWFFCCLCLCFDCSHGGDEGTKDYPFAAANKRAYAYNSLPISANGSVTSRFRLPPHDKAHQQLVPGYVNSFYG